MNANAGHREHRVNLKKLAFVSLKYLVQLHACSCLFLFGYHMSFRYTMLLDFICYYRIYINACFSKIWLIDLFSFMLVHVCFCLVTTYSMLLLMKIVNCSIGFALRLVGRLRIAWTCVKVLSLYNITGRYLLLLDIY